MNASDNNIVFVNQGSYYKNDEFEKVSLASSKNARKSIVLAIKSDNFQ